VYTTETLVLLRHYLESGLSKTAIADQLGICRRLVYHLIATGQLAAGDAIGEVLGSHIAIRNQRRLHTAMRCARLPAVKRLSDFDFSVQPSIPREQLENLHTPGFVERRENVVFRDLREARETCSTHRVERWMRENGLRALHGYRTRRWVSGCP
jgi:hypothetical protein